MRLTIENFKEGAFANVILDTPTNKAYKLFKSFLHPQTDKFDNREEEFNLFRRKVFHSEKDAYEIISKNAISKYFPNYYPDVVIEQILDSTGNDVSNHYLLDCCLTLDLISGKSSKQNDIDIRDCIYSHGINIDSVFIKLREIGVNFFIDADIFCNEDGIKIVDIATTDFSEFELLS